MIGIIDYDAGNLMSVCNSLKHLGFEFVIGDNPYALSDCDKLILPGVGAFPSAMIKLHERRLDDFIINQASRGIPLLGICLGMQIMFDYGNEINRAGGLGLLTGEVRMIQTPYKLPHIGWNSLERLQHNCPILRGITTNSYMYFVHSFMCECGDPTDIAAITYYGEAVTAVVQHGNIYGCQFHPEKSGEIGLTIYKNFANLVI